jgi:hypothetical protein
MTDTTAIAYPSAVRRGRTAWNAQSRSLWTLAEIGANVETTYGDDTIGKLAAEISGGDLSKSTLANYVTVWNAYPDGKRGTDKHHNAFSVYEKFASIEPMAERVRLVNEQHWTASEARAYVKSLNEPEPPAGEGEDEVDGESAGAGVTVDELELAMADAARLEGELLKAWARVDAIRAKRGMTPLTATAPDAEPAGVVVHSPRGIDSHPITEPVHNCPDCQKAGIAPAAPERAGSPRRARRSRALRH